MLSNSGDTLTWNKAKGYLLMLVTILTVGISMSSVENQNRALADSQTSQVQNGGIDFKELNPAWVSSDYAEKIPGNVSGIDPTTGNYYIDEWMPDKNFQKVVMFTLNRFSSLPNDVTNVHDITKDMLLQTSIFDGTLFGGVRGDDYKALMNTKSIEGLQYAKNLIRFGMAPDGNLNIANGAPVYSWAALTDISALKDLSDLNQVEIQFTHVSDISALANKPKLNILSMTYASVTDLSPLSSLPTYTTPDFQSVIGSTIKINPNTQKVVTTDDSVKNVGGEVITIKPFTGTDGSPSLINNFGTYASTAAGKNISASKNEWSDFKENSGYLTTWWEVTLPNKRAFSGVIIHPYIIDKTISAPITVHYQDEKGAEVKTDETSTGKIDAEYTAPTPNETIVNNGVTYHYVGVKEGESVPKTYTDQPQSFTYVYSQNSADVDLNYTVKTVDSSGNDLNKGYTAKGKSGAIINAPSINGYTASPTQATLEKDNQVITFVYTKSTGGGGTPTTPIQPSTPTTPATPIIPATPITPSTPVTPTNPDEPGGGLIAAKNAAVYSVKPIYLYQGKNFNKSQRIAFYTKKPRINRPMFVVTGYARSNTGKLRYQVRDVNHRDKTAGKRGYITASTKYVLPVYYQSNHKTLTVINPRGVNEYRQKNLTGKVKNYRQGTVLKVRGFVRHNLTTRYQLSNGHYITGNRKLVISGQYKQPKRVIVKHRINRYQTANLTKRNGSYKRGQRMTIKHYTFSHATNKQKRGTMRFAVKGGYITANQKFVRVNR